MEARERSFPSFSSPEEKKASRPRTAGGSVPTSSVHPLGTSAGSGKIRYYCSFRNTIDDVLASRGWQQVEEGDDFDFVWADREWIYAAFDKMHLESWQRLNHFRNGRELCRKDLMAKNMKKRRRALEKENRREEAQLYDFIPTTVSSYQIAYKYHIMLVITLFHTIVRPSTRVRDVCRRVQKDSGE